MSEKTNLSVSYLSLIERGRTSINLTTLEAISNGLNISPAYFFDLPAQQESHVVRSYEQPVYKVSDRIIYYGLSGMPKDKFSIMEPLIVILLPGQTYEDVLTYAHKGEEFGYVLEGRLTFFVDNIEYELYPGDSLHISSSHMHNWANLTNNIVKLLYVITPKTIG